MIRSQLPALLGLLLLGFWYGVISAPTFGQEPTGTQLEFTEGVIVLTDGRVFSGTIKTVAGGYRIDWNGTYAIVPFGKVDVTAENLNQAYLALRDRVLKPTAEDHLQLAEWCLENQLVGQARSEVSRALSLEPLRPEARVLMVQIDEILNPPQKSVQLPTAAAMTIDGFLRGTEHTSGGLSRDSQQDFMRHVQPLLLNKCGNAYCHGQAATNSFKLTPLQRGSAGNRLQIQANQDQVLARINRDEPSLSHLLVQATAPDAQHRKIFLGTRGQQQYQILADWVAGVTGKEISGGTSAVAASLEPEVVNPIQQTSGELPATTERPAWNEKALLDEVRAQTRPDPFDPEVFNRRVHGATARELRHQKLATEKNTDRQSKQ